LDYVVNFKFEKEINVKKLTLQLVVWATVIATYALPVLACGGGGR